jgi:hypothetical protein
MIEKDFMYKCLDRLRKHGFTTCVLFKPRFCRQLVDTIVMKDGLAYPIEFKGFRTPYPIEQKRKQIAIFNHSNTSFFVMKERHRKKKVFVEITSPNEGSWRELKELSKPFDAKNVALEKSEDKIMLGLLEKGE